MTGCVKTYVMQLAEAEGFAHVHFHVVPRAAHVDEDVQGPRVFTQLGRPVGERVPEQEQEQEQEQDQLAVAIATELGRGWPHATRRRLICRRPTGRAPCLGPVLTGR